MAHAVADALLGAAGLGDLGRHFPDTDPAWAGADTLVLLAQVATMVRGHGMRLVNADCTVVCERPRLAEYTDEMGRRLGSRCSCAPVNVKATRAEGLGTLGRVEGSPVWPWPWWRPRAPVPPTRAAPRRAPVPVAGRRAGRGRPAAPARRGRGRGGEPRCPARGAATVVGRGGAADQRGRPAERGRHGLGGDQVEGRQAVRELLAAGRRPVHEVWMADDLDPSAVLDDIERLATRERVRVVLVPRRRLDAGARTDAPQGVLARAAAPGGGRPRRRCAGRATGWRRSCSSSTASPIPTTWARCCAAPSAPASPAWCCPRHRAAHVTPTVTKVAAGAIEHLAMAVVPGVPNALQRMTQAGVTTVGLDASADLSLFASAGAGGGGGVDLAGPVALVIGAEGRGLASLTRRRCAVLVSIPQHGAIESLNVASAGAVAFFEVARLRAGRRAVGGSTPSGAAPSGSAPSGSGPNFVAQP